MHCADGEKSEQTSDRGENATVDRGVRKEEKKRLGEIGSLRPASFILHLVYLLGMSILAGLINMIRRAAVARNRSAFAHHHVCSEGRKEAEIIGTYLTCSLVNILPLLGSASWNMNMRAPRSLIGHRGKAN